MNDIIHLKTEPTTRDPVGYRHEIIAKARRVLAVLLQALRW
jgi:hypothetical protein